MTDDKKSFFWYYLNKTGGLHDPRIIIETIELLKEWLPDEHNMIVEERDLGWNDAIKNIKGNLK